jgi:hypothetical protein
MCDKHRITEEPYDAKVSSTVLESGGSREGVADFNCGIRNSLSQLGVGNQRPRRRAGSSS